MTRFFSSRAYGKEGGGLGGGERKSGKVLSTHRGGERGTSTIDVKKKEQKLPSLREGGVKGAGTVREEGKSGHKFRFK